MTTPPIPLYSPGTELHIKTGSALNFSGPVLKQEGDFLTIRDRRTNREITVNLLRIEFVEVLS